MMKDTQIVYMWEDIKQKAEECDLEVHRNADNFSVWLAGGKCIFCTNSIQALDGFMTCWKENVK